MTWIGRSDDCPMYQSVVPNTYRIDNEIEAICEYLGVEIVTDMEGNTKCIKKGRENETKE